MNPPGNAGLSHEPGHPLATNGHTLGSQLSVDTRHPIGAPGPAVDIHYPVPQCPVSQLPARWATPQPRVVAAGGDTQQTTHAPHRIVGLVSLHEPKRRRGVDPVSSANQAAAFARISFSSRRIRFSRRK